MRHLRGIDGLKIEGRNHRENHCPGFGSQRHVAQMNAIEGRFADTEHQRPTLLERHVGGAGDERVGKAVGDGCQGTHRAGQDDHAVRWVATGGDGSANI
jgi:hypothetical protein